MTHTLSSGEISIVPDTIDAYESSSVHGNRVHEILGTGEHDAVLRPAGRRSGVLALNIVDEAAAYAAESALRGPLVWTFVSDELPTLNMTFVVDDRGRVTRTLDPQTGASWVVAFPWQEIGA
jgi:hypothetical protein